MRVLIIGGSIAGLTLAHCLEKARIDYVLLEKKEEIAPQEGASIGILPNGGRIMEQLGLYHQIEQLIEPLARAHVTYPDGFHFTSQYPALLQQRSVNMPCPLHVPPPPPSKLMGEILGSATLLHSWIDRSCCRSSRRGRFNPAE